MPRRCSIGSRFSGFWVEADDVYVYVEVVVVVVVVIVGVVGMDEEIDLGNDGCSVRCAFVRLSRTVDLVDIPDMCASSLRAS